MSADFTTRLERLPHWSTPTLSRFTKLAASTDLKSSPQEYVRGQNLKQLVSRSGPLDASRSVSILRQIAAALNKAGQAKIVHRDIKPENILLMPSGEAKVADFGLARVIDQSQIDLTQAGLTMGTPLYMSPEQVEGKALDQRSDLYSCGATAFYMLAGHAPFEGETPLSVAIQHLQNAPPSLRDQRTDVPTELCDIVAKLLAKKPTDRHRNAAELLLELRNLDVEGTQYHVPLDVDALADTSDSIGGLEATRQLQNLMNTQAVLRIPSGNRWRTLLLVCVAFAIGGVAAGLTRSGSVLRWDETATVAIERQETAELQYINACFANTEEAWKSVAKFHDPIKSSERSLLCFARSIPVGSLLHEPGRPTSSLRFVPRIGRRYRSRVSGDRLSGPSHYSRPAQRD